MHFMHLAGLFYTKNLSPEVKDIFTQSEKLALSGLGLYEYVQLSIIL
jgi:hypothetical protein